MARVASLKRFRAALKKRGCDGSAIEEMCEAARNTQARKQHRITIGLMLATLVDWDMIEEMVAVAAESCGVDASKFSEITRSSSEDHSGIPW